MVWLANMEADWQNNICAVHRFCRNVLMFWNLICLHLRIVFWIPHPQRPSTRGTVGADGKEFVGTSLQGCKHEREELNASLAVLANGQPGSGESSTTWRVVRALLSVVAKEWLRCNLDSVKRTVMWCSGAGVVTLSNAAWLDASRVLLGWSLRSGCCNWSSPVSLGCPLELRVKDVIP